MSVDVAVIGAGVSGLTTAYELSRRGHRVAVLERQVRAGGNAVSERIGGFLMEHGPSSVNAAAPVAAALSRSLGLDGLRCDLGSGVRYRYLTGEAGLRRISTHPLGFLFSDHLSLQARIRLLAEPFVPPNRGDEEETVARFWGRRFGPEFVDRVIDPLVGGLFAGRAAELSMPAVFPALLDFERRYGSITRAVLGRGRPGARMPGRRLYSWRQGIGTLPAALVRHLGPALKTGIAVRRLGPCPDGFRVEAGPAGSLAAKAIVIATQPHVAATLLEGMDGAAADAAAEIEAPPLAVVFLGYRREEVAHPLDGLGYLTPASEGRALTGALFCSTMFPGRAPEGCVAVAGYIGGAPAPERARRGPADLIAAAQVEFRDLLGARGDPVIARVRQWPRGLPQYALGHSRRVAALRGTEDRRPGLFVTGNYFQGPSVAACVAQASEAATRVHRFLIDRKDGVRGRAQACALSSHRV
ncbi:MAG: protoporphyrinogen oxidase [Kiloniellaceae bacterium]